VRYATAEICDNIIYSQAIYFRSTFQQC